MGVLVALLLGEGWLRLTHPALPSLAPLESMGPEAQAAFERATSRADMASGCRPTRVARPPATIAAVMPPMQKSTMAASTHGETRTGMGSDAVKPSS